jgi:hypothetical protein
MSDLVILTLQNGEIDNCISLENAKEKANACSHVDGKIFVEIIPEGGGPITTLEFDRKSCDWIAI